MMINFVVSDIHSFYSIFKKALDEKGFDINNENHRLIICGDLFDRAKEAKELLKELSDNFSLVQLGMSRIRNITSKK